MIEAKDFEFYLKNILTTELLQAKITYITIEYNYACIRGKLF